MADQDNKHKINEDLKKYREAQNKKFAEERAAREQENLVRNGHDEQHAAEQQAQREIQDAEDEKDNVSQQENQQSLPPQQAAIKNTLSSFLMEQDVLHFTVEKVASKNMHNVADNIQTETAISLRVEGQTSSRSLNLKDNEVIRATHKKGYIIQNNQNHVQLHLKRDPLDATKDVKLKKDDVKILIEQQARMMLKNYLIGREQALEKDPEAKFSRIILDGTRKDLCAVARNTLLFSLHDFYKNEKTEYNRLFGEDTAPQALLDVRVKLPFWKSPRVSSKENYLKSGELKTVYNDLKNARSFEEESPQNEDTAPRPERR